MEKYLWNLALAVLLLFMIAATVTAQNTNEKEAVLEAVQTVFDAMAEADSAKAASVFIDGGHTFRIDEEGHISLSENSAFAQSIGNFKQEVVERIWDAQVLVDENIAMAWTPYDLHVDGQFSHCGTNLISLIKTDDEWKISDITYNVKREQCEESPLGPPDQ